MAELVESITKILGSHTGRDKVCRALQYGMMLLILKLNNMKGRDILREKC